MTQRFYLESLGCPKNDVDSDKIIGTLLADGLVQTDDASQADLVVVNTCAFIEDARRESIDTVLELSNQKKSGARVVVTGCMAERYGSELAESLPEADHIAGFGVPIMLTKKSVSVTSQSVPAFDLLNLPRPKSRAPWAYVKIAEGCDRNCGFCAIPSFRGPQRSRDIDQILREVDELEVQEIVLIAQDLASYGKDRPSELGAGSIVPLVQAVAKRVARTRLLYLYPSDLTDELIHAMLETDVPYFDLSLQHVSKPHLRRMRRWGDGDRFLKRIEDIRAAAAVFKGRTVTVKRAMVVPGSHAVRNQAIAEGLDKILIAAGVDFREPGCSMCLAMNPDKLAPGERAASTSNRNFEGRQGRGGRTHLVSPAVAAATAIAGHFASPGELT